MQVAKSGNSPVAPKPGREELLKRLRTFRGRLPADFKFDRDGANAR
jgi:antitoxin MazE